MFPIEQGLMNLTLMRVSQKSSHYVSLDEGATEGYTLRLSFFEPLGKTDGNSQNLGDPDSHS